MRMASVPRPIPETFTSGSSRRPVAFSSLASPSSLARMATAAPSDITQISRRVSGQATIGAFRTSSTVSRSCFWLYGLWYALRWFFTDT